MNIAKSVARLTGVMLCGGSFLSFQCETEAAVVFEETVVLGTRTERPLEEASPSTSLVTRAEFESTQKRELVDVLEYESGITVVNQGGIGSLASVFIRGTESNHTAFLLDGRRLPPGFGGQYNVGQLGLENLASVEIFKGPNSGLYGPDAIGGVINLRTLDPFAGDPQRLSLLAEGGSWWTARGDALGAWRNESFGISAGVGGVRTDNDQPNSEYEQGSGVVNAVYRATDRLSFDLLAVASASSVGLPNATVLPTYPENQKNDISSFLISPGLRWEADEWGIRSFYSRSEGKLEARQTESFGGFDNDNDFETTTDEFELQLDYTGIDDVVLTGGISYLRNHYERTPGPTSFSTPFDESVSNTGVFGQAQFFLTEQTTVVGSLRLDHYSDYGDDSNPVTGSLQVDHLVESTDTMLSAKAGRGFAPPTGNDLSGSPSGDLAPEKSWSFEVGFEQPLPETEASFSAVLFYNTIEDLIQAAPPTFIPENLSETETWGLELGANWQVSEEWLFNASFTFLHAEVSEGSYFLTGSPGDQLIRRPKYSGTLGAYFEPTAALFFGAEARWAADTVDNDFGFPTSIVDLDDFFVVRVFGDWQVTERIKAFGRIENLTDADYQETFGFPSPGIGAFAGLSVEL